MKKVIEKTLFRGAEKAEIEQLFSHLELIAPALAAAGVLTLIEGVGVALDAPAFGVDVAADVELDDAQPAAAATQISAAAVADSRPAPDLLAPGFTAVASMSGGVSYAVQSH